MAMEMSSSQHEMVHEQRPVMSTDLFLAAMKGDGDVLIQRLGLLEEQKQVKGTTEASHCAPQQIKTENQTVQSELQSATRFGDTVLHLLVTEGHNGLALMVFQRDKSLLKAQNNILETPLYCAAKVGNEKVIHNLIQSDPVVVKDALAKTNKKGDTALHIAAKNDHKDIGRVLMNLDPEVVCKVNDEMKSPLYMAIIEGHTMMVQRMLGVDPTLACTPFLDGMFPIHEAARMGNLNLLNHFLKKYPDGARLRDPRGRNIFHIAAEENQQKIFSGVFKDASFREMIERMNTAMNYEGNTPFHIAAMKGHSTVMRAIWEHCQVAETVRNRQGLTPFQLSTMQVAITNEDIDDADIRYYIKKEGDKFTPKWFDDIMGPSLENKWETTQVIGLGSVLITTVAFSASFAIPGGYNQNNGTPILGRRYIFRAFILANALAFIQGFLSLFVLLGRAQKGPNRFIVNFAKSTFMFAASSMIVAFGLGLYVTLAPVCLPISILLIVITLILGSPAVFIVLFKGISYYGTTSHDFNRTMTTIVVSFLLIFCLAFI